MNRSTATILIAGYALLTAPAFAQKLSNPRWETRTADNGARLLSGVETFRLGRDTGNAVRADGYTVAIRVTRTNETILCDRVPYTFRWDTSRAPEGWNWIGIVLVDPNGILPDRVIDSLKVYVRNNSATPLPEVPLAAPSPTMAANQPEARGGRSVLNSRLRGRIVRTPRLLRLPETVEPRELAGVVSEFTDLTAIPRVMKLAKSNDTLYMGLPDGGVAIWNEKSKKGKIVHIVGTTGTVRSLTVARERVIWTCENADTVYSWNPDTAVVVAVDAAEISEPDVDDSVQVPTSGPSVTASAYTPWIERIAALGRNVVLMGASATRVWDGEGRMQLLSDILPDDIAKAYSDTLVRCYVGSAPDSRDAVLLMATPSLGTPGGEVHIWSGSTNNLRSKWQDLGVFPTTADFVTSRSPELVVTPTSIALPEKPDPVTGKAGLQLFSLKGYREPVKTEILPLGVSGEYNTRAPQSADMVSTGDSGIWWSKNGIVFHADQSNQKRECYMPWNGAGSTVSALLADTNGAYIATDKGVRRILPDHPNDTDGYSGYVRVPLGDDLAVPHSDREQKLLASVEEWQGAPYKWGGVSKTGTDCSGFVGAVHQQLGITIPRTSVEMAKTDKGQRVISELHYGDTLVFPGHVALYIGNGRTAETVGGSSNSNNGSVSKSTIWRRRDVVVKRFLPDDQ